MIGEPDYRAMVDARLAEQRARPRRPLIPLTERGWVLLACLLFWGGVALKACAG